MKAKAIFPHSEAPRIWWEPVAPNPGPPENYTEAGAGGGKRFYYETARKRPELAEIYGLPVFAFYDARADAVIYVTRGGFAGSREIGRLRGSFSVSEFLRLESALMERNRPEDWSI